MDQVLQIRGSRRLTMQTCHCEGPQQQQPSWRAPEAQTPAADGKPTLDGGEVEPFSDPLPFDHS